MEANSNWVIWLYGKQNGVSKNSRICYAIEDRLSIFNQADGNVGTFDKVYDITRVFSDWGFDLDKPITIENLKVLIIPGPITLSHVEVMTGGIPSLVLDVFEDTITAAKTKVAEEYTVASWNKFSIELNKAELLLANPTSQSDIDKQVISLNTAMDNLVKTTQKLDYSKLNNLLNYLKGLNSHIYTSNSWKTFETAKQKATTDLNATTQVQLDEVYEQLNAAYLGLILASKSDATICEYKLNADNWQAKQGGGQMPVITNEGSALKVAAPQDSWPYASYKETWNYISTNNKVILQLNATGTQQPWNIAWYIKQDGKTYDISLGRSKILNSISGITIDLESFDIVGAINGEYDISDIFIDNGIDLSRSFEITGSNIFAASGPVTISQFILSDGTNGAITINPYELQRLTDILKLLKKEDYTLDSWDKLSSAVDSAKELLKGNPTMSQIEMAYTKLLEAEKLMKPAEDNKEVKVTSVKLEPSKTIIAGQKLKLTAIIFPAAATNKKVTWTTSDAKVATVSQTGEVTTRAAGTVKIKVTAADGSGKYAICTITVKAKALSVTVKAAGYTMKKNTVYLVKGKNVSLSSLVSPANATKGVKYKVKAGAKYVTLNSLGKITAGKKAGKATITVTSKDGLKSKTITVYVVTKAKANTKLTVKKLSPIKVGKSLKLEVTVSAKTTQKITYRVINGTKVAKVDTYGVVRGKKIGTAKIKVTCGSKTKKVTVKITK